MDLSTIFFTVHLHVPGLENFAKNLATPWVKLNHLLRNQVQEYKDINITIAK